MTQLNQCFIETKYLFKQKRHMKTAIKCQKTEKLIEVQPIMDRMPGTRIAHKEDQKETLSEMVYGKPIRLPGEFFNSGTETGTTDFVKDLQQGRET